MNNKYISLFSSQKEIDFVKFIKETFDFSGDLNDHDDKKYIEYIKSEKSNMIIVSENKNISVPIIQSLDKDLKIIIIDKHTNFSEKQNKNKILPELLSRGKNVYCLGLNDDSLSDIDLNIMNNSDILYATQKMIEKKNIKNFSELIIKNIDKHQVLISMIK